MNPRERASKNAVGSPKRVVRLAPHHRAFNRAGLLGMRRSRSRRVDGGRGVCAVVVPLGGHAELTVNLGIQILEMVDLRDLSQEPACIFTPVVAPLRPWGSGDRVRVA